jgi:virulence-associated protein VapD
LPQVSNRLIRIDLLLSSQQDYVAHRHSRRAADMAKLFQAIYHLKAKPWFPTSVRDIRAFGMEQWSDFTGVVKGV